jgi:hypothetical protein
MSSVPYQEGEVVRVEELDIGKTIVCNNLELAAENVYDADENENVGNQCGAAEFLDVAEHGEC